MSHLNEDNANEVEQRPVAEEPPVTDEPPVVNNAPVADNEPVADEPPAASEPPAAEDVVPKESTVTINGAVKHQSEIDTSDGAYSQKTGLVLDITDGDNSGSAALYMLTPQKFQIEGIYSRNLFSQNVTPQDNFKVSAAYRNQATFSPDGVKDQNRISLQQNYTHKFDNGWKVGAYVNENAKATVSPTGFTPSIGYLAGISFGKGRVSGYAEHQGDWKIAKSMPFSSCVNLGLKVSL